MNRHLRDSGNKTVNYWHLRCFASSKPSAAACLGILLIGLGTPPQLRADNPKWPVDFGSDLRSASPDNTNLVSLGSLTCPQPFAEVRQFARELTMGPIPATGPTVAAPQAAGVEPSVIRLRAINQIDVQPSAAIAAWPDNFQSIIKRPAASPQTELIPGVVSQAAYFPSSGSVVEQLPGTKLLSLDQAASSSGVSTTAFSQLNRYLSVSNKPQSLAASEAIFPQLSVNTGTVTMVHDDLVKNAVGGPSGLFSAARLAWNYENLRLESGIGFAWTTWLEGSKPIFDVSNRENVVWNLSLLYYPLGDIPWRPFVLLGTGITQLNTLSNNAQETSATVFTGLSHRN
jgi:hypothetical protein